MLRRQQDIRTILILLWSTIFISYLFYKISGNINLFELFFLFIICTFNTFIVALINHNHRHHPIFKKEYLNRFTNIWISILIGAPSTRLHLVHHFNHHRYYPDHQDWSHFAVCAKGQGLKRLFSYLKNAIHKMNSNRNLLVDTKLKKIMIREERIAIYLSALILLILNFPIFLLIILPGWICGQLLLLTSNLLNHDYCEENQTVNNSRDFISPFENWIFCNNGYHTAHHLNPSLHWSELPDLHRNQVILIKKKRFIENSFFSFLLDYILWNSSIQKMEEEYLTQQ